MGFLDEVLVLLEWVLLQGQWFVTVQRFVRIFVALLLLFCGAGEAELALCSRWPACARCTFHFLKIFFQFKDNKAKHNTIS